jgi:hypothetical protein
MPSEFVSMAKGIADWTEKFNDKTSTSNRTSRQVPKK